MLRQVLLVSTSLLASCSLFNKKIHKFESDPSGLKTKAEPQEEYVYNCQVGREYVVIHNFLRDAKMIEVSAGEAHRIASEVVGGCTGAAERFIRVYRLLSKVEAGAIKSIAMASKYAKLSDAAAYSFVEIFKHTYLKQYLDMSLADAVQIADKLSHNVSSKLGETPEKAYLELVDFCLSPNGLGLSKPQCGKLSAEITHFGIGFEANVGEVYVEAIEFLRDQEGPNLSTVDARKVAEELVQASPYALENFRTVFTFAQSEEGLGMSRKDASNLALGVAKKTKSLVR